MQDNNPAASAARELKAAARDALRASSQWAHTALQWVDERSKQMSNRNREQEQREQAQSNRYSTSGYGADEGDYGSQQQRAENLSGGRREQYGDRDVQGRHSQGAYGTRRDENLRGFGREGSYPQSGHGHSSPDDFGHRESGSRGWQRQGDAPSSGAQSHLGQGTAQGRGYERYAGSRDFDDQDFSQDYSQGASHYGSQGFGAQGSQGVYGPQGFGSQGGIGTQHGYGSSGFGDYDRQGFRASQPGQQPQRGSSGQWRSSEPGQGYGASTGGYRGLGPKNYTRSDERIREDLNERLTDSDEIDARGITVEVSNGVATLSGTVDQRWMKHRAEDIADSCSGIRDVNNQIRVKNQQSDLHSSSSGSSALGGSSSTRPGTPGSGSSASASGASATGSTSGAAGQSGGNTGASNPGTSTSSRPSGGSGPTAT